jgi:hypothetical protein
MMLRPHKFNDVKKGINKILEFIDKNREDQKFEEKVELKGRKKRGFWTLLSMLYIERITSFLE